MYLRHILNSSKFTYGMASTQERVQQHIRNYDEFRVAQQWDVFRILKRSQFRSASGFRASR